eukprot:gnl/MRDRNA2_/MRDRNA2_140047_c0_seq1.p1 gnl/MRDRNA2_/MRDRNA2_140047_c0~~gnl/MRDRNA2_/MRDRNA2_140047_c0_seq1.p1  ORF type:complete len:441 (+),score=80.01 gnl/MRDRNA2_/MRDRNA2_140047_c0_seq1:29-1351(+)
MQQQGVVPNLVICSALVSACENSKQPERAVELFQAMKEQNVVPDEAVFNASESEWNLEALKDLQQRGVLRDVNAYGTYCAKMRACSEMNKSKAFRQLVQLPNLLQGMLSFQAPDAQRNLSDSMKSEAQRLYKLAVAAEKSGDRDSAQSLYGQAYELWPELEVETSDSDNDDFEDPPDFDGINGDGKDGVAELQPQLSQDHVRAIDSEWWRSERVMLEIRRLLMVQHVVCIDSFADQACIDNVHAEIKHARSKGLLQDSNTSWRGESVYWTDYKNDLGWASLKILVDNVDGLIRQLKADGVPGMANVTSRMRPMVACYPGNGARSKMHFDNHCADGKGDYCNGRRLTATVYFNTGWQPSHGGLLRVFNANKKKLCSTVDGSVKVDIAPIAGRLVLYWSDFRVPHEVRPVHVDRYAVTLWYMDCEEKSQRLLASDPTSKSTH